MENDDDVDFVALSSELSESTLRALREHLKEKSDGYENSMKPESFVETVSKCATSNSDYKEKSYWDDRFTTENSFDWLLTYEQLKEFLLPHFKDEYRRALVIGCGNSNFSSSLYDDNFFKDIVNIDFSDVIINKMQVNNREARPNMSWITMDMLDLKFEPNTFDVVIDKASMDALFVDEGDVWDPNENVIISVDKMCEGISKVLKSGGIYIQISFSQPHFRMKYLLNMWKKDDDNGYKNMEKSNDNQNLEENIQGITLLSGYCKKYDWNVSHSVIEIERGCFNYFMYTAIKS